MKKKSIIFLCQSYVTWWVRRGGVAITCFSNSNVWVTRPAIYIWSKQYVFEKNSVMFKPKLVQFRGTSVLSSQNKNLC